MIEQKISTSETMHRNLPKNAFQNAKKQFQIHHCIISRSRVNSEVRPRRKNKKGKVKNEGGEAVTIR